MSTMWIMSFTDQQQSVYDIAITLMYRETPNDCLLSVPHYKLPGHMSNYKNHPQNHIIILLHTINPKANLICKRVNLICKRMKLTPKKWFPKNLIPKTVSLICKVWGSKHGRARRYKCVTCLPFFGLLICSSRRTEFQLAKEGKLCLLFFCGIFFSSLNLLGSLPKTLYPNLCLCSAVRIIKTGNVGASNRICTHQFRKKKDKMGPQR